MGSAGHDDSSQKAIEPDLVDVGNRLLTRPSSTDELLVLLEVWTPFLLWAHIHMRVNVRVRVFMFAVCISL